VDAYASQQQQHTETKHLEVLLAMNIIASKQASKHSPLM
jgi:hypothetical protein